MFFKKKEKEEPPKKSPKELLKERYLIRCKENTKSILSKLEEKYFKAINMVKEEDDKEKVKERFKNIANFMEHIDWNSKINEVLKNTTDEVAATCCLQLSWDTVRDDVNLMVSKLTTFLEGVKQNGK